MPNKLSAAVDEWCQRAEELACVVTLGDIINGNREDPVRLSMTLHC